MNPMWASASASPSFFHLVCAWCVCVHRRVNENWNSASLAGSPNSTMIIITMIGKNERIHSNWISFDIRSQSEWHCSNVSIFSVYLFFLHGEMPRNMYGFFRLNCNMNISARVMFMFTFEAQKAFRISNTYNLIYWHFAYINTHTHIHRNEWNFTLFDINAICMVWYGMVFLKWNGSIWFWHGEIRY